MQVNVGSLDRAVRMIVGVVLVVAALFSGMAVFDGAVLKYGAVIVGLVMIGTAAVRFCPLYTVLGIRTCRN